MFNFVLMAFALLGGGPGGRYLGHVLKKAKLDIEDQYFKPETTVVLV